MGRCTGSRQGEESSPRRKPSGSRGHSSHSPGKGVRHSRSRPRSHLVPFVLLLLTIATARAATPADFRQKVGIYVWGELAAGLPAAAKDAKRLGADQAVRVFIGPG